MDRLRIHGDYYGRSDGGRAYNVEIGQGETIKEIRYRKALSRSSESQVTGLCSFTFVTDANIYQAEELNQINSKEYWRHICDEKQFSVEIPNDLDINSFLNSETIYKSDWIIGFKGELEIV